MDCTRRYLQLCLEVGSDATFRPAYHEPGLWVRPVPAAGGPSPTLRVRAADLLF